MVQKRRLTPKAARRPGQDQVVARQATNFPMVGMTLPAYQYDPRDRHRRGPDRTTVKRSRWQRFRQRTTLKRSVICLVILVLLIGGWVFGKFAYNAHKLFGGSIFGVFSSQKLRGEAEGCVNILLAGNSADDVGHNGGRLTDSIMLVSIDTKNNKAFMLSIPRDLWVKLPGDGHSKINSAYPFGEDADFNESGYPNGGMGELEQIISQSLDIPIHYYGLVNYAAFKDAVNAVGGVDLNIQSDDPRGLYDPNIDWTTHGPLVKLTNGVHHLNGQQALDLARARGDAYNSYGFAESDFARTQHQRQLLTALKDRTMSLGVLSNPKKLTDLTDAVGSNVKTDFQISEMRRLYEILKKISNNQIKSLSLNDDNGRNLLKSYSSPNGQSALIPAAGLDDYSDIQAFIRKHMSSNPVTQEDARVAVLNGTTTAGLATKIKYKLRGESINVSYIGDAGNTAQKTSVIIDLSHNTKPATKAALLKIFGNHLTTQNPYGSSYDVDFIIVLGQDRATTNSSQ